MNNLAKNQIEDIMNSFDVDSSGLLQTSVVRARERRMSHIFFFRDWYNIMTIQGLNLSRAYKIYDNTFGKRNVFIEPGRINMTPYINLDTLKFKVNLYREMLKHEKDEQKRMDYEFKIKKLKDYINKAEKKNEFVFSERNIDKIIEDEMSL